MISAECPSCGVEVQFTVSPKIGERVTCKMCETELEVVWLDPIELDWPFEEVDYEEEYEDYEEDYDY